MGKGSKFPMIAFIIRVYFGLNFILDQYLISTSPSSGSNKNPSNILERSLPAFLDSADDFEETLALRADSLPTTAEDGEASLGIKDLIIGGVGGTVTLPCPALDEYFNGGSRRFGNNDNKVVAINNIDTENTVTKWYRHGPNRNPIYIVLIPYPPHVRIDYDGRTRIIPQTSSLVLSDLKFSDQGIYMCKILYLKKPADTRGQNSFVKLLVQSKPQIISEPPPNTYARLNQEALTFNCTAKGVPPPLVYWEKVVSNHMLLSRSSTDPYILKQSTSIVESADGMRNNVLEHSTEISTATLTLSKITRYHKGEYRCVANNSQGSDSFSIYLNIAEPPIIITLPKNVTTLEGLSAKFECKVNAFPNNLTFLWLKDGQDISMMPGYASRYSISTHTGSLSINPTKKTDFGKYTCHPNNGIYPSPIGSAYLNIQYPATVLWHLIKDPYYLPRSMPGFLECPIESNPPMQFVIWSKGGKILDYSQANPIGPSYIVLPNGTLFISNVSQVHEGIYGCTPYNKIGTAGSSRDFRVVVRDPPIFINNPSSLYELKARDSITIPCTALGDPQPSINWIRENGKSLPVGRSFVSAGNLTITSAQKEDHGKLVCQAINNVATISIPVYLKITDTSPHTPTNVTVEPGVYGALVKWIPGYDGGHRQQFILWYKESWNIPVSLSSASFNETKYYEEPQFNSIRVNYSFIFVIDLKPHTQYIFQVQARNDLGLSPKSEPTLHRMRAFSPPKYLASAMQGLSHRSVYSTLTGNDRIAPPMKISSYIKDGGDLVVLNWRNADGGSLNPLFYVVEYRDLDNSWKRLENAIQAPDTDGSLISYTIDRNKFLAGMVGKGATSDIHKYAFRVRSYTVDLKSQPSDIFEVPFTSMVKPWLTKTLMAGIIGGVSFFLLASTLALMAILLFCRSKQRKIKLEHEKMDVQKQVHRSHRHHKSKKKLTNGHAIYEPNSHRYDDKKVERLQSTPSTRTGQDTLPQPHKSKEYEQYATHAKRDHGMSGKFWDETRAKARRFGDALKIRGEKKYCTSPTVDNEYDEIVWDDHYMSCKISNLVSKQRPSIVIDVPSPDPTPVVRCRLPDETLSLGIVPHSVHTSNARLGDNGLFKKLLFGLSSPSFGYSYDTGNCINSRIPSPNPISCLRKKFVSPLKMTSWKNDHKSPIKRVYGQEKERGHTMLDSSKSFTTAHDPTLKIITLSNLHYHSPRQGKINPPNQTTNRQYPVDYGSESLTRSDYTNNCHSLTKTYYRYGDDVNDDLSKLYFLNPMSNSMEVGQSAAPLYSLDEDFCSHLEHLDLQQRSQECSFKDTSVIQGTGNRGGDTTFETTISGQLSSCGGSKDSDKDSGIHAKEHIWSDDKGMTHNLDKGVVYPLAANLRGTCGRHPDYVSQFQKTLMTRHSTPKENRNDSTNTDDDGKSRIKKANDYNKCKNIVLFRYSSCENVSRVEGSPESKASHPPPTHKTSPNLSSNFDRDSLARKPTNNLSCRLTLTSYSGHHHGRPNVKALFDQTNESHSSNVQQHTYFSHRNESSSNGTRDLVDLRNITDTVNGYNSDNNFNQRISVDDCKGNEAIQNFGSYDELQHFSGTKDGRHPRRYYHNAIEPQDTFLSYPNDYERFSQFSSSLV